MSGRRRSLRTRLLFTFGITLVLVLVANAGYLLLTGRRTSRERLESAALQFAVLATPALGQSFDTYFGSGFFKFRQFVLDLLARSSEITAILIADVEGRVIFDSRQMETHPSGPDTPAGLTGERLEAVKRVQPTQIRGRREGGESLEIVVPYLEDWGRHRLSAIYHVSHASLEGQFRRSVVRALQIVALSGLLVSLLGLVLGTRLTRPLAALTQGVQEVARGNYAERLRIHSGDELQVVAEAFNDMASRLQQTIGDLKRSLERWRSLVEGAPVVVLSVNAEGVVEFANLPEAQAKRLLGGPVLDVLEAPEEARQALREVAQSGQPRSFRVETASFGGGDRRWYLIHAGAVREGETTLGLTLVGIDVTEAQKVQAERERLLEEMERRNEELERFTYTVSHDLRSPLVTVQGFLGFLEKDIESGRKDRAAADLARIRAAASTMERLLRELLELSRVGRVTNPPEDVPLQALAEGVRTTLAGRLAAAGASLDIEERLPVLFGDRARLHEVVQNLVDNAAKFMGAQEHPIIVVGARPGPDGPVCFVRDNGIGIDPQHHERVFGLFERLDPAVEGTGIGLALVKRIVEVHGGRVWVESAGRGQGAVFCFTLPGRSGEPASPLPGAGRATA